MAFTPTADTPSGRVWTKSRWADPWQLTPHLIPTQSSSLLSPELSTATLHCSYGHGLLPGDSALRTVTPVTGAGYFVLIQWFDSVSSRWWLGFAGRPVTTPLRAAASGLPAAGTQRIPCYGLERTLQMQRIDTTVHDYPLGGDFWKRHDTGTTFNATDVGNRLDRDDELLFAAPHNFTRSFWSFGTTHWTSRQIVQHLLTYHLPQPTGTAVGIPWQIGDLSMVPDWDRPTLATDGRTLAECLDEILSRDRLLGWRLSPQITPPYVDMTGTLVPPDVTAVTIQPLSRTAEPIVLPGLGVLAANPTRHTLTSIDPLTSIDVAEDAADLVDQVVVEGPREIAVVSLTMSQLINGWTTAQTNQYATGITSHPAWAGAAQWQRRQMLEHHRRSARLRYVYRSLVLPSDWDGATVGPHRVFEPVPTSPGQVTTYRPNMANVEILDDLPLYTEVNYAGPIASVDEAAGRNRRPPLMLIGRPGSPGVFDRADRLGSYAIGVSPAVPGLAFGMSVDPDNSRGGPGLRIDVRGAPPHAIAGAAPFTDADAPQSTYQGYNYHDLRCTVALRGDRRPRHAIPEVPSAAGLDFLQRRVIRIEHPSLEHVRITPGTVVDLATDGTAIVSDGGVLRDPSALLRSLAILAAQSWCTPQHRVDIESARLMPQIAAGDIITAVDDTTVTSTVLEVRIDAPIGDAAESTPAMLTRITAAGSRADPIQLIRPQSEPT